MTEIAPAADTRCCACHNSGKVDIGGKWYCGVHDPRRRKARQAEYAERVAATKAANARLETRAATAAEALGGLSFELLGRRGTAKDGHVHVLRPYVVLSLADVERLAAATQETNR